MSEQNRPPFFRLNNPFIWGFVLTLVVLVPIGILFSQSRCSNLPNASEWCQTKWSQLRLLAPNEIGDAIAGVSSSLAFIWLFIAVWLQSQELKDQRKQIAEQTEEFKITNNALAAQRFDQAFFGLLSTYNQIISDIDLRSNGKEVRGRDCFVAFSNRLRGQCSSLNPRLSSLTEDQIENAYDRFWFDNQSNLGHYFRFLFNAFRFISENVDFEKKHHSRLLRSQLSDQELLLLFYNCLSKQGKSFLKYAKMYALFDNLPHDLLFDPAHARLMPNEAWGRNVPKVSIQ